MYYCPSCGEPITWKPCQCGKPLEYEIDTPVPTEEQMATLIQQETKRVKAIKGNNFHGVVAIRWKTGYAIIEADALTRMPQSQINKLFGGTPSEKRKNVRHR